MDIVNAQEEFTETLRVILIDLLGVLNMTDDLLVYAKNRPEHHMRLIAGLKRLGGQGITLRLHKCEFYRASLKFFGQNF
jgi:hypothetical protein